MAKVKKKKRHNNVHLQDFRKIIKTKHNSIWTPELNCIYKPVDIADTWFTIVKTVSKQPNICELDNLYKYEFPKNMIKCKQVILCPTLDQKLILDRWFDAYGHMYNTALRKIKNHYKETGKLLLNWKKLRTSYLKVYKKDIINGSQLPQFTKNTKIKAHILDCAIQLACANYKSAISNFKTGHIKKFRIRYWRKSRQNKMLDIEASFFVNGSICPKLFGSFRCKYKTNGEYKDFDLNSVNKTSKIHYNSLINQYTLLVPVDVDMINKKVINKIISLDPGLRKFMTGLSENECIKIGTECMNKLKELFARKDAILENPNISGKIKKKHEIRLNRKITNYVDELHWKVINYLTNNYSTILIGDMSAKRIVSKEGNMSKINKRITMSLSFYKFRQRLEYKCKTRGNKYRLINESYTTKVCTECSYINDNVGANEVYKCPKCNDTKDRDVHSCKGIHIKQFMSKEK